MSAKNFEILCVGTELLLGDIVNTNAAYLARELAALGQNVYYQSVVGDNPVRLKSALELAFSRADAVIMTGGLGPTGDDLTKETVAEYFGLALELHPPSLARLESFFAGSGRTMTENNRKQALMPEGAVVFENHNGTAPGLALECGGRLAILLPGPPREMVPMFEESVRALLRKSSEQVLISRTVHLFGIGESDAEDRLRDLMESGKNPTVAPYAKEGEVQLRVTASAESERAAFRKTEPLLEEIRLRVGEYIYGVDAGSLEHALVSELSARGKTLAVAESCTGGLVAKRITDIAGASQVFLAGAVTYSNESKTALLDVPEETLGAHGAVSAETAAAMAEGIRERTGADIAVSTTGIAGPGGGTDEKPVGLVWVGVSDSSGTETVRLMLERGYREQRSLIRHLASSNALHIVLKRIKTT